MSRLLLDTTVVIDALRGRPAAERIRGFRANGIEPWFSVITVEEVWRGLRPDEITVAQKLFSGMRLASLGRAQGEQAGAWRREFAARGITLHQADCLIAAAALGADAALATANISDFPMTELVVEHWPIGT